MPSLSGWLPIRGFARDSEPWAEWIYAGEHRLTSPFFTDSVSLLGCESRREAPLPRSSRRPDGLIFHMSRCGSTLISRSLAAADSVRVISEAPPLDDMVRLGRPDWLESMVAALAGPERHLIFKLDAWHIRSLPLFRAAFPDTPWIFVFRDPREVLVSQLRQPGIPALGGAIDPAILGMTLEDAIALNRQRWTARVLMNLMTAALNHRGGLFVDYTDLPDAILSGIANHFALKLSAREETQVLQAASQDAKMPSRNFESDRDGKQTEARSLEPDPAHAELLSLYAKLYQSPSRILSR